MWIELTTIFLAASVFLYCLFAGADFGAGMLEAFAGKDRADEQQ
jgi:cytochrome bd-type quinol oxidase subunit 2